MAVLQVVGFIGYLAVGLIQFIAIQEGLVSWIGLPSFLAFIAALFLAWFPLIGSVMGMVGAIKFWGWQWYWATLLFFWPYAFLIVGGGVVAVLAAWDSQRRKSTS